MHILFLSSWFPYPANNGSKIRVYNLLRGLAQRHEITLVSFTDRPGEPVPPQLKALCRQVYTVPEKPYNPTSLQALLGLFQPKPRVLVDRYEPRMAEIIRRELASGRCDLVIASQWYTASYLEGMQNVPAIFEEMEAGVFDEGPARLNPLQRLRRALMIAKFRTYFRRLIPQFAACTVVSEVEREKVRSLVPHYPGLEVIPNAVGVDDYRDVREDPQPGQLIFTGSFTYAPNYDAMLWFVQDILPRVRAEFPQASLTITGDHTGMPFPQVENVRLAGFVDDVRPLIASSWASIVPIRVGGGTRLKILEAMALRTPVITTTKGAEGLDVRAEEHLLVADSPEDFAKAVIRLLSDPALRARLAASGYELVKRKYDWKVVVPCFVELAERTAAGAAVQDLAFETKPE